MLKSYLFAGNARLERCLISDPAHVVLGDIGPHVRDIQIALIYLDGCIIDESEKLAMRYGPSTAAAVLAYKTKRQIINRAYQSSADNIVGKMTIACLDQEMFDYQYTPASSPGRGRCRSYGVPAPLAVRDPLLLQNVEALREA
jgi:peptidoglycan hydrolase-like protein with peptidoglycan-binding domain